MKIGFSFGRCVRDIVEGKVAIDDVLMIQARTRMLTREQIEGVIKDYLFRDGYLDGLDREECLTVAYELWDQGKLHQPRATGGKGVVYASWMVGRNEVWMDLAPTTITDNPTVQSAWENYQMALKFAAT